MKDRFIKWLIRKFIINKGMTHFKTEIEELRKQIKVEFPGYHLARNGSGRRKKNVWDLSASKTERLGDSISNDYRTSHLGKFPGKNMGD